MYERWTGPAQVVDAEREQTGLSQAMSIAGDLDGDGDDEIVVAAPGVYGEQLGAVAIFEDLWSGTTTTASADLVIDGRYLFGRFGLGLAIDGDFEGDGLDDLVVSEPLNADWSGSVWRFPGSALAAALP